MPQIDAYFNAMFPADAVWIRDARPATVIQALAPHPDTRLALTLTLMSNPYTSNAPDGHRVTRRDDVFFNRGRFVGVLRGATSAAS